MLSFPVRKTVTKQQEASRDHIFLWGLSSLRQHKQKKTFPHVPHVLCIRFYAALIKYSLLLPVGHTFPSG